MIGELAILNVGAGDTKLTLDPSKPDEVKRAAKIVKDMIRRGFVVLVEVGSDDKGPFYRRAHDFDEQTAEYIIAGEVNEELTDNEQKPAGKTPRGRKAAPRRANKRVPATGTRAVGVARTAGG